MLDQGVYLAPSGYEGWFLSAAHGDEELELNDRRRPRGGARGGAGSYFEIVNSRVM